MRRKQSIFLHVQLTKIVSEQVLCRWSGDSEGATAVRFEMKPWNNKYFLNNSNNKLGSSSGGGFIIRLGLGSCAAHTCRCRSQGPPRFRV